MRHLVTGGSGFLGNLIAQHLVARGEEVRILDIWEDPDRPKQADFILSDVLDRDKVREAVKGVNVVHHTAALVPVTKAGGLFRKVNVEGTGVVAEEAARAGVESFVYMSSSAIYGIQNARRRFCLAASGRGIRSEQIGR
jgi:Nucleoside-diphosphate-sugar epimerases